MDTSEVDFAVAALSSGTTWQLQELVETVLEDVDTLVAGLRRFPGSGALAMVGFDEDVFLLVRVDGADVRLLLSDVTAADEWDLARTAVERLGLLFAEDDDAEPAGDVGLLADLGLDAEEMAELIDDDELYSEEILSEVADALGFGPAFDDLVGLTSA